MSRERGDGGRYTEPVHPEDALDVFEGVEGPVVTAADVAEALDCSRETARRKLRTLEDWGLVASREAAGRLVRWRVEPPTAECGIGSTDPFREIEPGASGESDVSERIDEVLYDRP